MCQKNPDPAISIAKATVIMKAYQKVKKLEQQQLEQGKSGKQHDWKPPPNGWYKINMDAAIDNNLHIGGFAVVIKDSSKKVTEAAAKSISFDGDVPFAEAEVYK